MRSWSTPPMTLARPRLLARVGWHAHQEAKTPETLCKASRAEQCVPGSWITGSKLCSAESDQHFADREFVGTRLAVEELDGLAVPVHGAVGRELGECVVAGTQRVVDRFATSAG